MKPWEMNWQAEANKVKTSEKKPWEQKWEAAKINAQDYDGSIFMGEDGEDVKPFEKFNKFFGGLIELSPSEKTSSELLKDFGKNITTFEVNEKEIETKPLMKAMGKAAEQGISSVDWGEVGKALGRGSLEFIKNTTSGNLRIVGDWYKDESDTSNMTPLEKHNVGYNNFISKAYTRTADLIDTVIDLGLESDFLKPDEKIFSGEFEENPSLTRAISTIGSGLPSIVGGAGVYKITKSAILATALLSEIDAQDIYFGAREKGVGKLGSTALLTIGTAGTYVGEKIGLDAIFGKKTRPFAKRVVDSMLSEGLTESAQTWWQNAVKKYGYDDTQKLMQGVLESGIGGALTGGVATTFLGGVYESRDSMKEKGATDAELDALQENMATEIAKHRDLIEPMFEQNIQKSLDSLEEVINSNIDAAEVEKAKKISSDLKNIEDKYYDMLKGKMPEEQAKSTSELLRNMAFFGSKMTGLTPAEFEQQEFPKMDWVKTFKEIQTKAVKMGNRYINKDKLSLARFLQFNGGLVDKGGELKAFDARKTFPMLINNKNGMSLDDATLMAWERGYFPEFPERPEINDLLNALDDEIRGIRKRYQPEYQKIVDERLAEEKAIESEGQLDKYLAENLGLSDEQVKNMSAEEKQNRYNEAQEKQEELSLSEDEQERYATMRENGATHREAMDNIKGEVFDEEDLIPFQWEDVAAENALLDEENPVYDGETININGIERTVYNSNGDRIAKSKEALENFYRWFGDSKVVDEQGRPLVVYHGTRAMKWGKPLPEFSIFSRANSRAYQNRVGFFFGETENFVRNFGDRIMPVYLNLQNPKIFKKGTPTNEELSLEQKEVDTAKSDDTKYIAQKILNNSKKYTDAYDKFIMDMYHKSGLIPYQNSMYGDFNDAMQLGRDEAYDIADNYREELQNDGYDGVIIVDTRVDANSNNGKPNTQYVAFEPNQIKSTSNRGTFDINEDNINYQGEEENKTLNITNRKNPSRIKQRTIEDFLPEEKDAFDRYIKNRPDGERILRNLEKNKYDDKGNITGYYKTVVEDVFIQQAIFDYVNGNEVNYESAIDVRTSGGSISGIKSLLQSEGLKAKEGVENKLEFLADNYLDNQILAHPSKVVNAVNSSLLNCNPSRDCAIFCYATHGNYIRGSYNMPKSEVIDIVARYHPKKLAQMIAKEYKMTTEYNMGKALRLFDKGDGDNHWIDVARELNNQGVRVAVFTKRPDFMRKMNELKTKDGQEINLTMLSIDSSNQNLAEENKDLNVAYVYQGEQNLKFVKKLQDEGRLNVVLPVKLDAKVMSKEEVNKLRENGIETKKICPIDAGWLKLPASGRIKPNVPQNGKLMPAKVGTWNCALCDRMGGVGCYFGKTTEQIIAYLQDVEKNNLKLKEKDVKIIVDGFEEILKRTPITKGLTNEQLAQFGITEQDIENRIRLLSPTMGESNARNFAGYSLIFNWFGQRYTNVQQGVQDKATETGLLQSENRPTERDNEAAQSISREGETTKGKQSDTTRISSDISDNSGTNVRVNYQGEQSPQGAYINRTVYLFEKADVSTIPHEMAHFWREELKSFDNAQAKALLEAADRWETAEFERLYKVIERDNGYAVANKDGSIVYDRQGKGFTTEGEAMDYAKNELFARGFERYLAEGKAPNKSMKQVFHNFLMWLHKKLRDAVSLKLNLSPDIKQIYAEILGGQDIDAFLNTDPETFIQNRVKLAKDREEYLDGEIEKAIAAKSEKVKDKSGKGFSEIWANAMIPLSTRAKRVSPKLRTRLRRYEFDLANSLNKKYAEITPFMDKWKNMSEEDAIAFDLALKNDYIKKQLEIVDKYGAREEWEQVRKLLEETFDEAINAGLDLGYRADYFPRKVKDTQGFLDYIRGSEHWSRFEEALREVDPDNQFTIEQQADFINKYLRGFVKVDLMPNKYGSEKTRSIETIDYELNKFYAPSIEALVSYVEGLNSRIQASKFLGKDSENLEESIGGYLGYLLDNNIIAPKQMDEVREILRARFDAKGVSNKWLRTGRDMSYIYTMGGINSAITQIDDLSVSMFKAGVWNTLTTAFESKNITKKDLGLESIAAEFIDGSKTSKMVNQVFKATGLDAIDGFAKETLINAEIKKFQKMYKEDKGQLQKLLEPILEDETAQTMEDIKNGVVSDNVLYVLFSELSDVQPISLSELPAFYNRGGNLRVLYMLKSFAIKRIDIFRNECYDKIRSKDWNTRKEGVQNLFKLAATMIVLGASKDKLIDLLYGRDVDLTETVINNLLGLVGISKFQIYQMRDKGFDETVRDIIFPPLFSVLSDLLSDVINTVSGKREIKDMEVLKGIPIVGRFYYWWIGRGKEKGKGKKKKY